MKFIRLRQWNCVMCANWWFRWMMMVMKRCIIGQRQILNGKAHVIIRDRENFSLVDLDCRVQWTQMTFWFEIIFNKEFVGDIVGNNRDQALWKTIHKIAGRVGHSKQDLYCWLKNHWQWLKFGFGTLMLMDMLEFVLTAFRTTTWSWTVMNSKWHNFLQRL